MPCTDHLEGLRAVEMDARRCLHVQARLSVEYRDRERQVDTAEGVHDVGKLVEVKGNRMLNGDAKILLDGGHDLRQAFRKTGIDLIRARSASVGDEEVARDGEESQAMMGGVGVEDHDDVAVDAVHPL